MIVKIVLFLLLCASAQAIAVAYVTLLSFPMTVGGAGFEETAIGVYELFAPAYALISILTLALFPLYAISMVLGASFAIATRTFFGSGWSQVDVYWAAAPAMACAANALVVFARRRIFRQ